MKLTQHDYYPVLTRLRRIMGRTCKIRSGPAKNLCFDSGRASPSSFLSGAYERPVQVALSSLLNKGDVFYDVGANMGFFSVLAASIVGPSGAIYALEPVPENASTIEKNAFLNKFHNINILRVAAASNSGRSELILTKDAGGATLKTAGIPPDRIGCITVEKVAIDELVQSGSLRKPDVVKIDVEGAELDVLDGMIDVLKETGPNMIIELDDATQVKCENKLNNCRIILENIGYRTRILQNSYADGKWFVRHIVAIHP